MADIKFMLPDPIPLISPRVAASLSAPATTATPADSAAPVPAPDSAHTAASGKSADSELTAQVQSQSRGSDGRILLSLLVEGRTLTVTSDKPLPAGTQLTLTVSEHNGKPQLNVSRVQLPAQSLPGTQTPSAQPASVVQVLSQLLASRLPLLADVPQKNDGADSALYARQTPLSNAAAGTEKLQTLISLSAGASSARHISSGTGSVQVTQQLLSLAQKTLLPMTPAAPVQVSAATQAGSSASAAQTAQPAPHTGAALAQKNDPAMPLQAARILNDWLQQLPTAQQLATPAGVTGAISNSGIRYEQKLFALAERLRQGPAAGTADGGSTQTNASTAAQPAMQTNTGRSALPDLFRSLWSRAASPATGNLPANSTAQTTPSLATPSLTTPATAGSGAALPPLPIPQASASALSSGDILAAVRARLETPVPAQTDVSQLLTQDHKAVLGRAILHWLNATRAADSPAIRELPLSFTATDAAEPLRLLHTALARTETEQLTRLQQGADAGISIPLFYRAQDELREVRLSMKQEGGSKATDGKKHICWSLRLHFDLQRLGPLDVDLNLSLPHLSATFWSEQQHTLASLNQALTPLRHTLTSLGVEVGELHARFGQLPAETRNQISQRLVDVHS